MEDKELLNSEEVKEVLPSEEPSPIEEAPKAEEPPKDETESEKPVSKKKRYPMC